MRLANVVGHANGTTTAMACATIKTHAWEAWTNVGCATDPVQCTNVAARESRKGIAIARVALWMPLAIAVGAVGRT